MSKSLFEVPFSDDDFGEGKEIPIENFKKRLEFYETDLQNTRRVGDKDQIRKSEQKYIEFVCECNEDEYKIWLGNVWDKQYYELMKLVKDVMENGKTSNNQSIGDELTQNFLLYRRCKLQREDSDTIILSSH